MKKTGFLLFMLPIISLAQNYSYLAGGRSAALAHSSVAFTDLWAVHHNQAALAFLENPVAGISFQQRYFLNDLNLGQAAIAYPVKPGCLGLSFSFFGFELFNQSKVGLSYARAFGKYFSLGLQINYHNFYVSEGSSNGGAVTFETGILARPLPNLNIGFHLFNPSQSYQNPEMELRLPLTGRLGASYNFGEKAAISAEVLKVQQIEDAQYSAGVEYQFIEDVFLRTGVGFQPFRNSFGLGLNLKHFSADISYEYAQILGSNANLSLQYQF